MPSPERRTDAERDRLVGECLALLEGGQVRSNFTREDLGRMDRRTLFSLLEDLRESAGAAHPDDVCPEHGVRLVPRGQHWDCPACGVTVRSCCEGGRCG